MTHTVNYTRRQLYKLVWATPLSRLSDELGVTDVALKKRCRKLNIPVPGKGYWQKLDTGKKVVKPRLPDYPESILVCFPGAHPAWTARVEARDHLLSSVRPRLTPRRRMRTHAIVRATTAKLQTLSPHGRYGWVWVKQEGLFDVKVAPQSIGRVTRLFNRLCAAIEDIGGEIHVGPGGPATILLNGVAIGIRLEEAIRLYVLCKARPGRKSINSATGRLKLRLDVESGYRCIHSWSDTDASPLEAKIPLILTAIRMRAAFCNSMNKRHMDEVAATVAAEVQRSEEESQVAQEERDFESLLDEATRWQRLKALMEYIDAIELNVPHAAEEAQLQGFILWAHHKIAELDPLNLYRRCRGPADAAQLATLKPRPIRSLTKRHMTAHPLKQSRSSTAGLAV